AVVGAAAYDRTVDLRLRPVEEQRLFVRGRSGGQLHAARGRGSVGESVIGIDGLRTDDLPPQQKPPDAPSNGFGQQRSAGELADDVRSRVMLFGDGLQPR